MKKIIIIFICIYTAAFATEVPQDSSSIIDTQSGKTEHTIAGGDEMGNVKAIFGIQSGEIEYEVAGGDEMGNVRVVFNNYGKNIRTAIRKNETDFDMYTLFDNGITYAVNDKKKTYFKADKKSIVSLETDFSKLTPEDKEKILDKECNVYSYNDSKFWVWKGIVLKIDSKNDSEDLMAISFKEEPTKTTYTIPENYKEETMPK